MLFGTKFGQHEKQKYIGAKKIETDGNDRRAQEFRSVLEELGLKGRSQPQESKVRGSKACQLEAMLVLEPPGSIWLESGLFIICVALISGFVFLSAKRRVFLFESYCGGQRRGCMESPAQL